MSPQSHPSSGEVHPLAHGVVVAGVHADFTELAFTFERGGLQVQDIAGTVFHSKFCSADNLKRRVETIGRAFDFKWG